MLRQFSGTCKYTLNIINRGKKITNFPLKFGREKYHAWIVTFSKRNLDENKKIKEKLERSEEERDTAWPYGTNGRTAIALAGNL